MNSLFSAPRCVGCTVTKRRAGCVRLGGVKLSGIGARDRHVDVRSGSSSLRVSLPTPFPAPTAPPAPPWGSAGRRSAIQLRVERPVHGEDRVARFPRQASQVDRHSVVTDLPPRFGSPPLDAIRYALLVMISRCIALMPRGRRTRPPAGPAAPCVGVAWSPRVFGDRTIPRPEWYCQIRFTITRADISSPATSAMRQHRPPAARPRPASVWNRRPFATTPGTPAPPFSPLAGQSAADQDERSGAAAPPRSPPARPGIL